MIDEHLILSPKMEKFGPKGILRAAGQGNDQCSGPRTHTQQQHTRNTNEYVDVRTHWLTGTLGITVIHEDMRTKPAPASSWTGPMDSENGRYENKSAGTMSSAQSKELQAFFSE